MLTLYDEAGNLTFDGSRRVVKTLGFLRVGGAGSAQGSSLSDSRFSLGRPFFIVLKDTGWFNGGANGTDVEVAIQNTTLTWQYPTADGSTVGLRPYATIMYGIY
jgi:hypothetical protein